MVVVLTCDMALALWHELKLDLAMAMSMSMVVGFV